MSRYGCSASSSSGGSSPATRRPPRPTQVAPACIGTSAPSRRHTIIASRDGDSAAASSAICFIGTTRPRRSEPSAVISTFASRVLQPRGDGRRGEPREDRHLDRAHVRARVRGDRRLGRHRQVDRDAVARLDAERDERLREPRHLVRQLRERQLGARRRPRRARPPRRVRRCASRPAVHAVPGDVQPARRRTRSPTPARARRSTTRSHGAQNSSPRSSTTAGQNHSGSSCERCWRAREVVEAVPAHQPHDVRALEHLLGRLPDDLGHGGNPTAAGTTDRLVRALHPRPGEAQVVHARGGLASGCS